MTTTIAPVIRAPRGNQLRCKGWQQEAALRCLMNNLDPEVAERPADLVVYGGIGKAARNWECASWNTWGMRRRCWCRAASRWPCFPRTSWRRE